MAAACWFSPVSARAQIPPIDAYVVPSGPGGPSEFRADAALIARTRAEYASAGVRFGDITVRPEMLESLGYDSNVTATQSPRGSVLERTIGTLSVDGDRETSRYQASVSVTDVEYFQRPALSHTDWTVSLGGSHDFGNDALFGNYSHQKETQTPGGLNSQQLSTALPYNVDDAKIGYRILLGRSFVIPAVDVTAYSFANGNLAGASLLETPQNRLVYTESVTSGYSLSSGGNLLLLVNASEAAYGTQAAGVPRPNYLDLAVLAGMDYDVDAVIRYRALVGYETRHFSAAEFKSISSPAVELSAVWTPSGKTTVTGTASRIIQASALGSTQSAVTLTSFQLGIDHELLANTLLSGTVGISSDAYKSAGTQVLETAGASFTYLINRHFVAVASYGFTTRGGSGNSGVAGGAYSDNRITLELRARL